MASGRSNYLAKKHLDQDFGGQAWTPPANLFIALFTARGTIAQAANNTNFVEVAGGSYARKSVVNNLTTWNPGTSTYPVEKTNAIAIDFGIPTANWGNIVACGAYDTITGGNLLYWGDLSSTVSAPSGTPVKFDVNVFKVLGQC